VRHLVSGATLFISSSTSFWFHLLHFQLIYSFTHHFILLWFTTVLIHNSLSFTPGLKPTCFTNPTLNNFTSSSRTAFMDYCPGRFFWATWFLFLVFAYFFVTVPCARLSWPSHQLLNACKYTVWYRIIRQACVLMKASPQFTIQIFF